MIYNLSPETISELENTIHQATNRGLYNCVKSACEFVKKMGPITTTKRILSTKELARKLVLAQQHGKSVEIISLNNKTLEENIKSIGKLEDGLITGAMVFSGFGVSAFVAGATKFFF